MPDQNQTNPTTSTPAPAPVEDSSAKADVPASTPAPTQTPAPAPTSVPDLTSDDAITGQGTLGVMENVRDKVKDVHNILIALSSDPSVDEIAAAIGLSLYLDRIGKRATAIYSGKTPNALEFLKPQTTLETSSDVLRDFVIALNKEKADHLRYKLDGDYVKIFVTPYKSRIDEDDLEFSYGDFNIELVLALDVASGIDLDDALREHGRVMHDATVVNMTNGNPGKFGDIEWSDKAKSSVSEMAADLVYSLEEDGVIEGEDATAFLTGIVAATEHFSNNSTTAASLQMAARLIESGANRELVSENIGLDVQNMFFTSPLEEPSKESEEETDEKNNLEIEHDEDGDAEDESESKDSDKTKKSEVTLNLKEEKTEEESKTKETSKLESKEESKEEPEEDDDAPKNSVLLADLQAAAESLSKAGAEITPEAVDGPVRIGDDSSSSSGESNPNPTSTFTAPTEPPISAPVESTMNMTTPSASAEPTKPAESTEPTEPTEPRQEKTITPSNDFTSEESSSNKYGKMLEEALAEANAAANAAVAMPPITPEPISTPPAPTPVAQTMNNPAMSAAPQVASVPEINGVPEINYAPAASQDLLPPPPTPPVDFSSSAPSSTPMMPSFGAVPPAPTATSGPALENNPLVVTPETKPGSFQIPTNP